MPPAGGASARKGVERMLSSPGFLVMAIVGLVITIGAVAILGPIGIAVAMILPAVIVAFWGARKKTE